MDFGDLATLIGALTGMVAAIGALYVAVRNSRKADEARDKALVAATKASDAADEAKASKAAVMLVGDNVVEVGKRIDGRLSELLETARALARAQGIAEGTEQERKRVAGEKPPEPSSP